MPVLLDAALRIRPEETSFERRGFSARSDRARLRLEAVGRTFVAGYRIGLSEGDPVRLAERLDRIDAERRGFAYEGAAMALVLRDELLPDPRSWVRALRPTATGSEGPETRLERFLAGPGRDHAYMLHVGAGWALARLRRDVGPYLERTDPLLGWLAVDGFGFHEGYFHSERWLGPDGTSSGRRATKGALARLVRLRRPERPGGYAGRVFDQGLGRSLWFVRGGDARAVARTIDALERPRRSDFWSGAGLACAYAGGASDAELRRLAARGEREQLAQGAAFAAEARERAGIPAAHTDRACRVFCGVPAGEAARRVRAIRAELERETDDGAASDVPAYGRWRRRVRATFPTGGTGTGAGRRAGKGGRPG